MKSDSKLIADVTLSHLGKIRPIDPLIAFRVLNRDDDRDVDAHALFVTRENVFCVLVSRQQASQMIKDLEIAFGWEDEGGEEDEY